MLKENPHLESDIHTDHNNLDGLLWISQGLKVLKMMMNIFNAAYFIGLFWFIMA